MHMLMMQNAMSKTLAMIVLWNSNVTINEDMVHIEETVG